MKKQLLITFDYELFLGKRSGTVENCLIRPTQMLLNVLVRNKVEHAIFFVDTTSLLRIGELENEAAKNDLQKIKKQLVDILQKGHYVFPHLHPHWLDAKYMSDTNQWDLSDIKRYRLHKLEIEEIDKLLEGSMKLIRAAQKEAGVSYEINGYRAGGWCIQPFDKLKALFLKHGLKNDFSVLREFKNTNENCYYDYSKAPVDEVYKFNDEVVLKDNSGLFTEFTISCIEIKPAVKFANRLVNKLLSFTNDFNLGDGISNNLSADKQTGEVEKEMVSVELLNRAKLKSYIRFFDSHNYMHFISHPKMLSRHNLKTFDRFLAYALKSNVNTDYTQILVE